MFQTLVTIRRALAPATFAAAWLLVVAPADAWDHSPRVCLPTICPCNCCPDYIGKPWPCLPCPAKQCLCDDYCAKPLPSFCPVSSCLCDDYCKKPLVCLPGIPCFPLYKCGPPANCLFPVK